MKRRGFAFAFALPVLMALALGAAAMPDEDGRLVVLTLPRATLAHEAVWLRVRVGVIPRGTAIVVRSGSGELLGSISPFAVRSGKEAGAYTIPLPDDAPEEGRVYVRLSVETPGAQPRPATTREVKEVKLVYVPVSR